LSKKSGSLVTGTIAVLIVTSVLVYSYFAGQLFFGIIAAGIIVLIEGILLFRPLLKDSLNLSGYRGEGESESIGVESTCLSDSRVYERPFFFIGVPFFIVLGGLFSKYESIFSIAYEGGTTLVMYHGLCLVSKNDKLNVKGKWYRGEKLGIQGNIVIAERIENLNSGLVFSKK
jgi:hypothetical protein